MDWCVLFVQTGKENMVQKKLNFLFGKYALSSYVPERLLPERRLGTIEYVSKIMFPGYVFIKAYQDKTLFNRLKDIPGCYRVLGNDSYFSRVPPEEMFLITKLAGDKEVIDISRIYIINSKVVVESGPLQGLEGIIKKIDPRKKRAKILLNIAEKPKTIDVGIEVISKVVNSV